MVQRLSPDPELEALIRDLNASAKTLGDPREPAMEIEDEPVVTGAPGSEITVAVGGPRWRLPQRTPEGEAWLAALLAGARTRAASDLLIVGGVPPMLRVAGRLDSAGASQLTGDATGLLCGALTPPERRGGLEASGTADFALGLPGVGRIRCNVHRERDQWAAAIRLLPEAVPDLATLNLPPGVARFAELEQGLLLVTGPAGSGKTTTLAALLKRILERRSVHVITIEDPVEFELAHGTSVVEHVELGRDAPSFAAALRSALRQNPDVLLIGEMRDPESISIAITAAETGHLVLSTLHTGDAPQTIHRILDSYPSRQIETVRAQLAHSLRAIVSQELLVRGDGQGRVPAVEILIGSDAVRNLIRQGKIAQLHSQIALERQLGMLERDLSLARLVRAGHVSASEARARARVPEELDRLLQGGELG